MHYKEKKVCDKSPIFVLGFTYQKRRALYWDASQDQLGETLTKFVNIASSDHPATVILYWPY